MKIEKTMSMQAFDTFVKCAVSPELDDRLQKIKQSISVKACLQEYGTYRFGMHRQSGHTLNSIYILPRYFPYTVFLYQNDMMVKHAKEDFKEMIHSDKSFANIMENSRVEFMSVHKFKKPDYWRGVRDFPNCVCLDVASMISNKIKGAMYDSCCDLMSRSGNLDFKLILLE